MPARGDSIRSAPAPASWWTLLLLATCAVGACTESETGAVPSAGNAGNAGTMAAAGTEPAAGTSATGGVGSGAGGSAGGSAGAEAVAGAAADPGGAAGSAGSVGAAGTAGMTADAGAVEPPEPVCPDGPFPTPEPGAVTDVCVGFDFKDGYTHNEGPTWVQAQNAFYFTNFIARDGESGDIIKYTPGGDCERFLEDVGCNGLAVTNDGNLLAACHLTRSVEEIDLETGEMSTLVDMYMGELLDTPNDLIVHSNGSIYFTNPPNELDGRPSGIGTATFWINPQGTVDRIMQGGNPNGIALSPDESVLYVVNAGTWDLDANGVPSNQRGAFLRGDGMGVDCAGNIYTSGGSILNPEGDEIGSFPGGTNLAFGGADGTTMLLVSRSRIRTIQMNLPGFP